MYQLSNRSMHSRHDTKFFNFLYFHKNLDQDHKNNILFEINSHQ